MLVAASLLCTAGCQSPRKRHPSKIATQLLRCSEFLRSAMFCRYSVRCLAMTGQGVSFALPDKSFGAGGTGSKHPGFFRGVLVTPLAGCGARHEDMAS